MIDKLSYVYILTNSAHKVLYTGVTGRSLAKRVWEHQNHVVKGFTDKYNVTKLVYLVYYEVFENLEHALLREKQIKAGSRKKKVGLIDNFNPNWKDLYLDIV